MNLIDKGMGGALNTAGDSRSPGPGNVFINDNRFTNSGSIQKLHENNVLSPALPDISQADGQAHQ